MITLPRPRNPPYRTPTPKNSPPPDQDASPKRKRTEQSQVNPVPLCVNTATQRELTPETGANSPRTKVAERFQDLDLDLRHVSSQDGELLTGSSQSPRKRVKRNPHLREVYARGEDVRTPGSGGVGVLEVAETPTAHEMESAMSSSSPASPTTALKGFQNPPLEPSRVPSSSPPFKRRLSPPPFQPPSPPTSASTSTTAATATEPPIPNSSTSEDQDLAALTWQESEITGHEIDVTSPDDDGEGINGIGFRPTAAIAYARSQKRRKAVEEWKAREAREARQRRMNRRRGGSSDPVVEGEGEGEARRSVRFVGVG